MLFSSAEGRERCCQEQLPPGCSEGRDTLFCTIKLLLFLLKLFCLFP